MGGEATHAVSEKTEERDPLGWPPGVGDNMRIAGRPVPPAEGALGRVSQVFVLCSLSSSMVLRFLFLPPVAQTFPVSPLGIVPGDKLGFFVVFLDSF